LSLCLKAVGLLPAGPSALPSPVRIGAGLWQRQRALLGVLTAAVRSEPDSQVKQAVTMTKRAIIRWWVWGLAAMMPGTILIPPNAVALASHDPDVSDGYGQTMVALRKHQQVELPTIRR